jgi:hypothetical protein
VEQVTSHRRDYVSGSIDNPIASMTAKCTSTEVLEDPISGDEESEL